MDKVFSFFASARKAVATAIGVVLTVLTAVNTVPFLPSSWHGVIVAVVGVLTVIATYVVPNAPKTS